MIDRVRNEMLHRVGLADLLKPRVNGQARSIRVIASEAKQSIVPHVEAWIASSLRSLQ
ncbi:hypothetical protein ACVW1C_005131 [Bradyrhizobium sp. USDA 4011]